MPYAMRNPRTKRLTGKFAAQVRILLPGQTKPAMYHVSGFDTYRAAEQAEELFRNSLGETRPKPAPEGVVSFRECAETFKANNPRWFNKTNHARYDVVLGYFGEKDVNSVRYDALTKFLAWLQPRLGGGKSNRTQRRYLDAIFKVLGEADNLEILTKGMPKRPKVSDTGMVRKPVGWPLERQILGWLDGHGYLVEAFTVRLLAATGMRFGELRAITAAKVELTENASGFWLYANETKTKRARWVALRVELARELRGILAVRPLPDYAHMRHIWEKARDSVGEHEGQTLHCLRHACVTRALDAKIPELRVKKYIGHSRGSVTAGYDHPEKEKQLADMLPLQQTVGELLECGKVVRLLSA